MQRECDERERGSPGGTWKSHAAHMGRRWIRNQDESVKTAQLKTKQANTVPCCRARGVCYTPRGHGALPALQEDTTDRLTLIPDPHRRDADDRIDRGVETGLLSRAVVV